MNRLKKLKKTFDDSPKNKLYSRKLQYVIDLYQDYQETNDKETANEIIENLAEMLLKLTSEGEAGDVTRTEFNSLANASALHGEAKGYSDLPHAARAIELMGEQNIYVTGGDFRTCPLESEKDIIEGFKQYMRFKSIEKGRIPSELTVLDYAKRLRRYIKELKKPIKMEELFVNLKSHVEHYFDDSENSEKNKQQHGAVIAALKKLLEYKEYRLSR